MNRKINEIEYGIAFSDGFGDIYINKHLKAYDKELYEQVLKHELEHEDGVYTEHDLANDLEDIFPLQRRIDFCSKYPKALFYMSPIFITKERILISWVQIFQYIIWLAILIFILKIVF